jgi:hypothetical protein
MARAFGRAAILMLGVSCLAAYGCGGQPTSPDSAGTGSYRWSIDGWVVSVDANARTFALLGPLASPYVLVETKQAQFRGDGISSFDQLVAAYRRGMTLKVTLLFSSATFPPSLPAYQPSSVEVQTSAPVPVTFNKQIDRIEVTPAPRLASRYYHDASVFVLPWTEFRQDGDCRSWDAVLAATGVSLCMAGEGYQVHSYGLHATKIGVWRRTGENDNCAGK